MIGPLVHLSMKPGRLHYNGRHSKLAVAVWRRENNRFDWALPLLETVPVILAPR